MLARAYAVHPFSSSLLSASVGATLRQLSAVLIPSPHSIVNEVDAAQPEIYTVDLDEVALARKHRSPSLGQLKRCIVIPIQLQCGLVISRCAYRDQRVFSLTEALQSAAELRISHSVDGLGFSESREQRFESDGSV